MGILGPPNPQRIQPPQYIGRYGPITPLGRIPRVEPALYLGIYGRATRPRQADRRFSGHQLRIWAPGENSAAAASRSRRLARRAARAQPCRRAVAAEPSRR